MTSNLKLPRGRILSLAQPQVMGILNVTPDSFSDGGNNYQLDNAVNQALSMLAQGASIIDIGGESTRPGAQLVTLEQELQRVIPVIEALRKQSDCVISIDTSKPQVMAQALDAGADIINDVRALSESGALQVVAQAGVPVCLMHMQGQPQTMQCQPSYSDLMSEIKRFFQQQITRCEKAGIEKQNIIIDPGFGFGKTLEHNFHLLAEFNQFESFGCPLLAGVSRKSMIGNLLGREVNERLAGSLAAAMIAVQKGANIVRVHDVQETKDALRILEASK